jgi:hypothetical protein
MAKGLHYIKGERMAKKYIFEGSGIGGLEIGSLISFIEIESVPIPVSSMRSILIFPDGHSEKYGYNNYGKYFSRDLDSIDTLSEFASSYPITLHSGHPIGRFQGCLIRCVYNVAAVKLGADNQIVEKLWLEGLDPTPPAGHVIPIVDMPVVALEAIHLLFRMNNDSGNYKAALPVQHMTSWSLDWQLEGLAEVTAAAPDYIPD